MKLSPPWLREFVDVPAADHRLAEDLTAAGITVEGVNGEGANTTFEMEITTNRPDAMNHYGVARECSAIYDLPLKPLEARLPASTGGDARASIARDETLASIEIQDKQGCARYTARVIRGVKIQASPESIVKRLAIVDQRPINNAADASNYTLWEMGHPTHAFDLDLLEGSKIIVRRAAKGETLKTLDGVDRKLSPDDLIIADVKKPVALAGVMGGFDSMITEKTKNILIESAWFDPVVVRKTAKRHGLHTDASHRFERGADFGATSIACSRVAMRILESGGGELQGSEIDAIARELDLAPIQFDRKEAARILGEDLGDTEILRILRHLGFTVIPDANSDYLVTVPSWRLDVEREIDLIEEIARLHGYDKFKKTLPAYAGAVIETPDAGKDQKLRSALLSLGYNEAVSLSFISHQDAEQFGSLPVIELENPLSEEASVMRTSLVPGLLNMLAYNMNRGNESVRLFEAGSVFAAVDGKSREPKQICLAATVVNLKASLPKGGILDVSKGENAAAAEAFRSFKGAIETLLEEFQHSDIQYDSQTSDYYHEGRSARVLLNGEAVAQFGQIDANVVAQKKIRQDIFVGEIYLERLYKNELRKIQYEPLPRYPAVERDFSFIFGDDVIFAKIQAAVSALKLTELRGFTPAEIFRGGSIAAGKYSGLLRATFQSYERTLRDEEVAEWSGKIVKALESLGGTQRA
jgi:phenylalanyl-tRNA synthetase beta chain